MNYNDEVTNKDLLVAASEVKVLVACVYKQLDQERKDIIYRHLKALNIMLETIYEDIMSD